jgi:L-threonylcarbamoyladenylate synthase
MIRASGPQVLPAGSADTIRAAVATLRDGGVIAVPTDTVYGLVCLFDSESGVQRLFEIKGRPRTKPVPVLLGTATELTLVARDIPHKAWPLIYAHWPGPVTIVVPALSSISGRITAGTGTVGTRVPAHPAVLDILEAVGLPFASSSANRSGQVPAVTAEQVVENLGHDVDIVVDGGDLGSQAIASTVVDLTTTPVLIRRRGAIPAAAIREALGARVEMAPGL